MKHNYLQNAIVGMGIGFPVTLMCMTMFGGWNDAIAELLVWLCASALYGILSGLIFSGKLEWSLPALLGLHCLGCTAVTLGAAMVCGYLTGLESMAAVLVPFAVIYVLIYAGCFCVMKHNERKINEALNDK